MSTDFTGDIEGLPLGNARVPRLCFGCGPLGGHDYGTVDIEEVKRAVREALDIGLRFFDTADIYGLGRSEIELADALSGRRHEAFIATKFGVRRDSTGKIHRDNSSGWIKTALSESLKRLKTDYVDLYQLHHWDGATPLDAIFETLSELMRSGSIRSFGVCNLPGEKLNEIFIPAGLVAFQDEFSLAKRDCENDIREVTDRHNLTFLSYGSLGQGILSGKYAQGATFGEDDRRSRSEYVNFHGEKLKENLALVERLNSVASQYPARSPAQIAVRWILDTLPKSAAIVGIKTRAQLREIVGALGWNLSPESAGKLSIP
ncbi:MAG: aldo/keto reductase [Deltaproteobacteria bacterium]|nr:aldo/keto reductase [Deltaproteobacteria bacterium]